MAGRNTNYNLWSKESALIEKTDNSITKFDEIATMLKGIPHSTESIGVSITYIKYDETFLSVVDRVKIASLLTKHNPNLV